MIIGIGADLCDMRRIEAVLARFGERFEKRVFTKKERAYCNAHAAPYTRFSKRFAAKEALAKALSTPRTGELRWKDVEITSSKNGRPKIKLHRTAKARLSKLTPKGQKAHIHVTLTDEPPYAQAFVIVEMRPIDLQAKA